MACVTRRPDAAVCIERQTTRRARSAAEAEPGDRRRTSPMHDGLIFPASKIDRVRTVMKEVAPAVTGFRLPTSEKSIGG
jgi:hypothetical protein